MNVGEDEEVEPIELHEGKQPIMGHILAQYSLKLGLKKFGKRAEDSTLKEMTQLHDMDTFFPRDAKTLTREQRVKALSSLLFIKEKRNGIVKSRTCVDGSPQREYIKKEDTASPTMAIESVFITGAIEAFEA